MACKTKKKKCRNWSSMTLKMKFSIIVLLSLDYPCLSRQERVEQFQHFLLKFTFNPYYKYYNKYCCKLYPEDCYRLLDSTGYINELLRGRVTKTESDGWIQFKISNVRFDDAGSYRCVVLGTQIYTDYDIEVTEASVPHSSPQPLLPSTMKPLSSSTALWPESSGPVLLEDNSDRVLQSFGLPRLFVVSTASMIVFTLVVGMVVNCHRVKTQRGQSDKCGETLCELQRQKAMEVNSVLYTTVDFRAHQKPKDVYATVRSSDPVEDIEYSTLAVHQ